MGTDSWWTIIELKPIIIVLVVLWVNIKLAIIIGLVDAYVVVVGSFLE